jgi:hypothetical protein
MEHIDMHSNLNFSAPAAVLAFLGAFGALALGSIAALVALFLKKPHAARFLGLGLGAGSAFYALLLLGFSLGSHEATLGRGEEKYFCEIDCHLAYSVTDVQRMPQADQTRYTVTLRTRFDETTISPTRPRDMPLTPNPRQVSLADGQGRAYPARSIRATPLLTPLKPGEAYSTALEFLVPTSASGLRLLVTADGFPEHLLIGSELSPLHKKTWLQIAN